MATKQVINFAGYLAAGSMLLLLQACSPSDSAPYYLNKSSTSQSTESTDTQSSTTVPATTTTTTTAPATSTPPPPPPMNPCTVYTGQSYPHGSTLYGYCRIGDAAGNLICFNHVSIAYYTCNNGKWIPQ